MDWANQARLAIGRVHLTLAPGVSLDERVKAIDAAYPFGERARWPYKAWLKERRAYLVKHGYQPRNGRPPAWAARLRAASSARRKSASRKSVNASSSSGSMTDGPGGIWPTATARDGDPKGNYILHSPTSFLARLSSRSIFFATFAAASPLPLGR